LHGRDEHVFSRSRLLFGVSAWSGASAVCRELVSTGESVHIRRKLKSDDDQRDAFVRAVDDIVSDLFTSLLPRLGDTDSDLGS
jgi:hypothetical protein